MRKRLQIFCLLLLPCLTLMGILGRGSPAALSASSDAAIPASADNWGLSFPAEHETPIGNATADFLTQYDAWYVGDTSQKVIYLTFDCGYENGNTEAILDALKKHSAPAHPQRCHRAAALYLLHQRRHSGRSAVEVGGHGLPLRPPDGAFRPGQVLTSRPAVSKKFHCPK